MLFIFLWLIVSQLATKLSYRRRLDKVINMMAMRINMITMGINLVKMMINLITLRINLITMRINMMTTLINLMTMRIIMSDPDDMRICIRSSHSVFFVKRNRRYPHRRKCAI